MKIGETLETVISSKDFWNNTKIQLDQNCTYTIFADPKDQKWTDGKVFKQVCTAEGFSHPLLDLFSFLKRYRKAKWFCLIGCINEHPKTFFKIGVLNENYTPKKSGILYCFANDAKKFYKNNSGSITIKIKRIE